MRHRFALAVVLGGALAAISAACHGPESATLPAEASTDAVASVVRDAAALDAGPPKETKLGAANFQVSVVDTPAWPESKTGARRLGYLRAGAVVPAYDRPIPNDDCKEGWFALVGGGYVCGKAATFVLTDGRVKLAPKQPDLDAGMPYRYGVSLGDETPLYRRVLSVEDRKKFEPWLIPKPPEEVAEKADERSDNADPDHPANAAGIASTSSSGNSATNGGAEEDPEQGKKRAGPVDAGAGERADAGPIRLKELRGHGVLVRKMVRGFYLALDRDFKAAHAHWWRTTFGFAVPFDRIMVQPGVTKHHGEWFAHGNAAASAAGTAALDGGTEDRVALGADGGAALAGAVGFVTVGYAHKVEVKDDGKAAWGAELPRRTALMLTGKTVTPQGSIYEETTDGYWVRPSDVTLARPQTPRDLGVNEKWIDVDLTRQALVAFEGKKPVFGTLISSGRRNLQDKEHDFPTPTGTYWIREKHVTTTMDGDVASDGPYSIEDVPWVMYFNGSYALHGAFWHDQFGNKRSHGCVNMAPEDARSIFAWSDPPLPEGWHGVFAKDERAGTRIVIHEDAPPKR